jgi:hypothetical protein
MRDDVPWKRISNEVVGRAIGEFFDEAVANDAAHDSRPPEVDASRAPREKWAFRIAPYADGYRATQTVDCEAEIAPTGAGEFDILASVGGECELLEFAAGPFLVDQAATEELARVRLLATLRELMQRCAED